MVPGLQIPNKVQTMHPILHKMWPHKLEPLATNSHAQFMSPASCRSKRVDDHSRFYARPMETSSTVQACRRPQSFLRKSNGDVINRSDSIRYFVALLPQHVSESLQGRWPEFSYPAALISSYGKYFLPLVLSIIPSCHTKDLAVQA